MDKAAWIEEKIKKLIDEGKSRDEAVAIANKMFDEMYGSMSTYKLPILPDTPCEALQGKKITQQMIDSALAYDKNFRPSYVYLNETDAHNNAGNRNLETLAQINRTFRENGHIVAEVIPNRKYKGDKFEELAAADGTHPGRSVDLWNKSLIPGCKSEFYLEGIALCGAQKPATVNLPAIYYSTEINGGVLTFSINTASQEMTMADNENKVDFAAMQKQLDDLQGKVDKQEGDIKTLSTERDHYKTEAETLAKGYKELKDKSDRQEVNSILDSKDFKGKFKVDERDSIIEMALSLKEDTVKFASGKTRYETYMDSIKNRPVVINLSTVAGNVPNNLSGSDAPADMNEAILQFAAENKLDTSKVEDLEKAERGAMQKHPELFRSNGGAN